MLIESERSVVRDIGTVAGLDHHVVAQCERLDRQRDREHAGVHGVVRIVTAVEVDHAHQGLLGARGVALFEHVSDHDVAVVAVSAADLFTEVR